ncbi:MAG: hypothetical protein KTR31_35700 [Myxococcales bacterium]|nr:hypothetical protein [Myxococcales bacterium]
MITMLAAALATSPAAHARPVVGVGLGTLGLEVAGVLGGGAIGLGVGGAMCRRDRVTECWAPVIGAGLGGISLGITGGLVGAATLPRAYGLQSRKPVLFALGGVGLGVTMVVAGGMTGVPALWRSGLIVTALAPPVGAAIGTIGAQPIDRRSGVALLPMTGRAHGIRLMATF